MGCTPRHLTPAILAFEINSGGAGSPLDSVGYGSKRTQSRSIQKQFSILKEFGEKEYS